jgi:heptosyltransferase-1
MGDVLHAMPAVAALRAAHPDWFIGWAIEPRWSDLLQITGDPEDLSQGGPPAVGGMIGRGLPARGLVDRWYRAAAGEWKKRPAAAGTLADIRALGRVLRGDRFDVCVDMQGSLKSAVVGRMAKATVFVGPDAPREWMARRLYGQRVEVTARHMVTQGCELLGAAVGEVLRPVRIPLPMDTEAEVWADGVVGREKFCLISAGGGWGAKVWPAEWFGKVAAWLGVAGVRTVVNASPVISEESQAAVAASEGYARAVPCSVRQLIALMRRAAVVIASDTGPLHLAAALERPVVAIFGPTDPMRNGPYGTRSRVLRDVESVTSYKRLREVDEGMLRVEVGDVVKAAMEMLG